MAKIGSENPQSVEVTFLGADRRLRSPDILGDDAGVSSSTGCDAGDAHWLGHRTQS